MPQFTKNPTIITLTISLRPNMKSLFGDWQSKLTAVIAGFDGFVSLEFLSSPKNPLQWSIVTRFCDVGSADIWNQSLQKKVLLTELQSIIRKNGLKEKTEEEVLLENGITEVIIAQVDPKNEKEYREWSAKIHQLEAKFEGFQGVYIQSPKQSNGTFWITLLQFSTSAHLDKWLTSNERLEVLNEAGHFISSLETHRIASPYAGWFSSIAQIEEVPPVWKQSMIVLLVLYPIVMLEIFYLNPLIQGLGASFSTFIGNVISVSLLGFPMIPPAIMMLSWWLYPKGKNRRLINILGTAVILLAYLLEVLISKYFFG